MGKCSENILKILMYALFELMAASNLPKLTAGTALAWPCVFPFKCRTGYAVQMQHVTFYVHNTVPLRATSYSPSVCNFSKMLHVMGWAET